MPKSPLGEFEQEVLMAILREGEGAFALEIRRAIEAATGRRVSKGAFYATLDRLERKGLAEWETAQPPPGRRTSTQRRYSVTPGGLSVLRAAFQVMGETMRRMSEALEEA